MDALYTTMMAALCQDSPRKIAQPSHATLLAQEPIPQNIYLSSLAIAALLSIHVLLRLPWETETETAHHHWTGPEALITSQKLPQSRAQKSEVSSIQQEFLLNY